MMICTQLRHLVVAACVVVLQSASARADEPSDKIKIVIRQILPAVGEFPFSCSANRAHGGRLAVTNRTYAEETNVLRAAPLSLHQLDSARLVPFSVNTLCELEASVDASWESVVFLYSPKGDGKYEFFDSSQAQPFSLTNQTLWKKQHGALFLARGLRTRNAPIRAALGLLQTELIEAATLVEQYSGSALQQSDDWRFSNLQSYLRLLRENVLVEVRHLEEIKAEAAAAIHEAESKVGLLQALKEKLGDSDEIALLEKDLQEQLKNARQKQADATSVLELAKSLLDRITAYQDRLIKARLGAQEAATLETFKRALDAGPTSR